jgi:ribosome biogenesis GTPase A
MEINWYPGQMAKARRLLRENLRMADAVVEVLDARIPASSRNPDLRNLLSAKTVVAALSKADLAEPVVTSAWKKALRRDYKALVVINAVSGDGIANLLAELLKLPRKKEGYPLRLIVAGIPNVGKSSLLNRLTGRRVTLTGNKPGLTRDKQWVRVREGLEILDTPGMLWPKIGSEEQAFHLAVTGAVKTEVVDTLQLGTKLVEYLSREAPYILQARYNIRESALSASELLEEIGAARGCLLKGGRTDPEAAASMLVHDFRHGRLGRISLERPECAEKGGKPSD